MDKPPAQDRSTSIIAPRRVDALTPLFEPRTVALIGATERTGSVGAAIWRNLTSGGFPGRVHPVTPSRPAVGGVRSFPSIKDVPERVDLAVVVVPAAAAPDVVGQCVEAGVGGAVVISAGFREAGPAGAELERRIAERIRGTGLRVIGPNCLGIMRPAGKLNATFAKDAARSGSVAFLSQSGALCTAVLDWSLRENVGFSAFVSTGSMLDVGWGDLIDHFVDDPRTKSLVIYMESVGDARAFLSAAREAALAKPIVVLKAGRTEAGARAAASHTGSLTGSDAVLDAAFRRAGVLRVERISDLFHMAQALSKQPRPAGPRLAVLTNAGGPGVLATDALLAHGGVLAELSPETRSALDKVLPAHWSRGNPMDVLGDAPPERFGQAAEILAKDPGHDGLLVAFAPQAMSDPAGTAERILAAFRGSGRPVLASWMGGAGVAAAVERLNAAGVPAYAYPDTAARVFAHMWRYAEDLRALYETPALAAPDEPARAEAAALLERSRKEGRTLLSEDEAKAVLFTYGIPVATILSAGDAEAAVRAAREIGYPVVLKLRSKTVTHKAAVGGVRLDLRDDDDVRAAFTGIRDAVAAAAGPDAFGGVTVQPMVRAEGVELILGAVPDAQFGPVVLFGAGGRWVEALRDTALALPPLTSTLARRLIERTKIAKALDGGRGRPPVDRAALEEALVRFARLVAEQPRIREIDVNPLLATPAGVTALDARIVLHDPKIPDADLPRTAIRPWPAAYAGRVLVSGPEWITIRPIRPEDEPLIVRFHGTLSEQSVYNRYFQILKIDQRTRHERLARLCFIDYDREMALVAERRDPATGKAEILGVGRLTKERDRRSAEFAILVSDAWQGRRLGTELLRRLVDVGRDGGQARIFGEILSENAAMQRVCAKLGFRLDHDPGEPVVHAVLDLH